MLLTGWTGTVEASLELQPAGQQAWAAVLLVCASTLAGSWLARRNSQRMTIWLAIASAMMLVTALVDLLPDAWHDASESGTPLWTVGLAAVFGFSVITYFTRKGCACPHDEGPARAGLHAPGLHRRVKEAVGAALYGGMGTAAALTLHRAIEGATLALTASVVIILALTVHSASEGLALAALLDMAKQRLAPWLVVACLSPAAGVLIATFKPLPQQWVPILLGVVIGVLSRTAIVGMRLAGSRQKTGRLSKRHLAIAATVSITAGALLAAAHGLHEDEEGTQTAERSGNAMASGPSSLTPLMLANAISLGDLSERQRRSLIGSLGR
jgi:zinc transporter ZupT